MPTAKQFEKTRRKIDASVFVAGQTEVLKQASVAAADLQYIRAGLAREKRLKLDGQVLIELHGVRAVQRRLFVFPKFAEALGCRRVGKIAAEVVHVDERLGHDEGHGTGDQSLPAVKDRVDKDERGRRRKACHDEIDHKLLQFLGVKAGDTIGEIEPGHAVDDLCDC